MAEIEEAKALDRRNTNGDPKNEKFKKWDFKKKNCFFITLNCETFKDDKPDYENSTKTLMNKYIKIKKYLLNLKYNYFLGCIEQNTNDFDHIHIFLQFNSPHKLCINKMEGANIQIMRSSVNNCINYIKKNNHILDELGEPRFITGAPTIKDILNSTNNDDILDNIDFRFYKCISDIKNNKYWRQGLFNTPKKIKFIDFNNIENHMDIFKYYHLAKLDEHHHYKELSVNTAIFYNKCIFKLLVKLNDSHNGFYFADIRNILIIYKNISEYREFLSEFEKIKPNLLSNHNIIKKIINED